MLIIVNPLSGGGRGLSRWKKIEKQLPPHSSLILQEHVQLKEHIPKAYQQGERLFIAAGGDGTVNSLANALVSALDRSQLNHVCLGAIGLGSSNDFHKALDSITYIDGIPCQIDPNTHMNRDLLHCQLDDSNHYALLNSSCGITAEANAFFNKGNRFLKFLKKLHTPSAILYAALHTLCFFRSNAMTIHIHSPKETISKKLNISNLGIVKSPFFAGDFAYEHGCVWNDGSFFLHSSENMSRPQLISLMHKLKKRQFKSSANSSSIQLGPQHKIEVESKVAIPLEFDGEVQWSKRIIFQLKHAFLKCCCANKGIPAHG